MTNKHDIIWLKSVDSTNNEARRRFSEIDNLSVLSAELQTAGRGQRGNIWHSLSGENLTFSIVLKFAINESGSLLPRLKASDQFAISEITALSVVDFLARSGIEAKIKWPNDIYVGDRKICGILIENSLQDRWLSSSIIGIGLNINQRNFDVNLPNPTSMYLESPAGKEFDLKECLETFMEIFDGYFKRYFNIKGGFTTIRTLYLSQLWRRHEIHTYRNIAENLLFKGMIRGVSDVGNLIVENLDSGEIKEFGFKEIGYIIDTIH